MNVMDLWVSPKPNLDWVELDPAKEYLVVHMFYREWPEFTRVVLVTPAGDFVTTTLDRLRVNRPHWFSQPVDTSPDEEAAIKVEFENPVDVLLYAENFRKKKAEGKDSEKS